MVLDANGGATLSVPLNDSLSEFKLVAVADAGTGLFGTGNGGLRTKQDLQLISGLPPLVREKDRYSALLTVRNGTAKAMSVSVSARAGDQSLDTKEVKLEAESAAELVWSADAPEEREFTHLGVPGQRQIQRQIERRQGQVAHHPASRSGRADHRSAG